jgi:hypothetical protein
MALYKYTSNKDPLDGTEEIRLPGREPVSVGGEVELSEDEHEVLKDRLNLRKVSESESDAEQGDSTTEGAQETSVKK